MRMNERIEGPFNFPAYKQESSEHQILKVVIIILYILLKNLYAVVFYILQ